MYVKKKTMIYRLLERHIQINIQTAIKTSENYQQNQITKKLKLVSWIQTKTMKYLYQWAN